MSRDTGPRSWQPAIILVAVLLLILSEGPTIARTGQLNINFVEMAHIAYKAFVTDSAVPPPIGQFSDDSVNASLPVVAAYHSILSSAPENPSALYGLGYLSLAIGDSRSAAKAFRALSSARANQVFVWNTIASHRSGDLDKLSWDEKEALARKLAEVAYQDLVTGRRNEALAILETATEIAPGLVEIWLDRIHYYYNEWEKAKSAYAQATAFNPEDPFLTLAGAYLSLYASQDSEQARMLAQKAMKSLEGVDTTTLSRPYMTWLYNGYLVNADLALQQGNRDLAIEWLRKAVHLPGSSPNRTVAQERLSQLTTLNTR